MDYEQGKISLHQCDRGSESAIFQPATNPQPSSEIQRRSFIKGLGVAGAALSAAPLLRVSATADDHGSISKGDAAILRFVAAAEIIESDIWLQYNELAGVQNGEVSKLASKLIPGYPSQVTGGNPCLHFRRQAVGQRHGPVHFGQHRRRTEPRSLPQRLPRFQGRGHRQSRRLSHSARQPGERIEQDVRPPDQL